MTVVGFMLGKLGAGATCLVGVSTPYLPAAPSTVPALPPVPVAEAHPDASPLASDIAALRVPMDARISPDGERVAYVVRIATFDPETKPSDNETSGGWKVEEQLFVVKRAGGEARQLTRSKDPIASFRWSPDGRSIAFVRRRGERMALHVIPLHGGEAEPVDTGELEPDAIEWSRDGASIAFLATLPLTKGEEEAAWRSGGVIDEETRYRPAELYVVPRAGGEPRRVTRGPESVVGFAWSPDGGRFALILARSSDPYEASLRRFTRIISAADGATVKELDPQPAVLDRISWSPDGRHVAYLRARGALTLLNALTVHDAASGRSWNAAAKLDPTLAAYAWSADSRRLTLLVHERTASKLYRVPVDGRSAKDLGETPRFIDRRSFDADRAGRFAAVISSTSADPHSPGVLDLDRVSVRVVARLNPQVAGWRLGRTEVVRWESPEGPEIEGVLTVTPHAADGEPAPLVVMPHGGPDSVTGLEFIGWAQYFAARGYSVFNPNYRGSLGYGRDFYAANRGRLGEIELVDIESGVDHLIQARKADPRRLYYGSWSWGGYLTIWTIAYTKRYRAAMVGAATVDATLQYALSDVSRGVAAEWDLKGNPWRQPELFERASPRRLLYRVTTPTLILHGENDARVPFVHSMILYRALKDVGCEVRLLRYPREPHLFHEPAHVAHQLASWAAWFDAH